MKTNREVETVVKLIMHSSGRMIRCRRGWQEMRRKDHASCRSCWRPWLHLVPALPHRRRVIETLATYGERRLFRIFALDFPILFWPVKFTRAT